MNCDSLFPNQKSYKQQARELKRNQDLLVPEGMKRSYLTSEWIDDELAKKRPIAVMIGNTTAALPQYGISNADIIYEAPIEGGLVRLLAIIQNYEDLEKLMSVQSCRHYFVNWALEYDAIYIHYGQVYLAKEFLSQDYVDNLNGMESNVDNVVYRRDSSRKAPHNAYITGETWICIIQDTYEDKIFLRQIKKPYLI